MSEPRIFLASDDVDDDGLPNEWVAAGMAEAATRVDAGAMFRADEVSPAWSVPLGWMADNEGVCRSCRAEVLWCLTPARRKAPINRDGTSHFATCPEAAQWRKRA